MNIRPINITVYVAFLTFMFGSVCSHSLLGAPKPTSSKACRLGGVPSVGGIFTCPDPCDVEALQPGKRSTTSPNKPVATYRRGQTVTIEYQRNNHGPGGFVRHTLVPVHKMMDERAHRKNAFH